MPTLIESETLDLNTDLTSAPSTLGEAKASKLASQSYTLRIKNPGPELDEHLLRFQEKNQLPTSSSSIIRTTQNDIYFCFIKFAERKDLLDSFVTYLNGSKAALEEDERKDGPFELEVIDSEHKLNLQLPGNLYIRGLLPTTRSEDLYKIFAPYGEVQSCKVIYDDYGFSKGYGFVNLANRMEADKAIESLNGRNVEGNNLFVNHHVSKTDRLKDLEIKRQNYSNLYVKNIPPKYPKDDLSALFSKFGKIDSVFLPHGEDGDNNKGYGFINFRYHKDAVNAEKELNNFEIQEGYKIEISRAERKREKTIYSEDAYHYGPAGYMPIAVPLSPHQVPIMPDQVFIPADGAVNMVAVPQSPVSDSTRLSVDAKNDGAMPSSTNETAKVEETNRHSKDKTAPGSDESNTEKKQISDSNAKGTKPRRKSSANYFMSSESNVLSSVNGLPIAGPDYQDSNLYITHLPLDFTDSDLEKLFSPFGPIVSAKVITYQRNSKSGKMDQPIGSRDAKGKDPESLVGKSKGFGFVCFQKPVYASKALVAMNGYKLDSAHILNISFAQRKENKFERGRLRHYNQNNLENFYRYLSYPAAPGYGYSSYNIQDGKLQDEKASFSFYEAPQAAVPFYPPPMSMMIPPAVEGYKAGNDKEHQTDDDSNLGSDDNGDEHNNNDDSRHEVDAAESASTSDMSDDTENVDPMAFPPSFVPYGSVYYYPYPQMYDAPAFVPAGSDERR